MTVQPPGAAPPDPIVDGLAGARSVDTHSRFSAEADLRHHAISSSSPHARESLLITAPIPEEQLLVFTYLWREGGTTWGRFVFVAGPDMTAPLFVSHAGDAKYDGDDLRDFTVDGLHWRQPEPLRAAEVTFAEDDVDLSLRFEGVHEPFSWHDNECGCPAWAAHDRYEQSGLVRGRLRLGNRKLDFSGGGHRDHSWGTRNWNELQHWKWMNAVTPDGSVSLHAMVMWVRGATLVNGYLNRDGIVSPIVTAEAHATLDEALVHRHVSGRFSDQAGREVALEADFAAGVSMPIQHLLLNEIGMAATLDGQPATAHVELGWPADYVRALT